MSLPVPFFDKNSCILPESSWRLAKVELPIFLTVNNLPLTENIPSSDSNSSLVFLSNFCLRSWLLVLRLKEFGYNFVKDESSSNFFFRSIINLLSSDI